MRHIDLRSACIRLAEVAGADDEPAAGGEDLLAVQHAPRRIERGEAHAVGMLRQGLVTVKQQVERLVEGDFVLAREQDAARAADAFERRLHRGRIDRGRLIAFEAEQDRAIGAVPVAGQGQRAIDLRRDLVDASAAATSLEVVRERAGGVHRPHRVGARRADADLEDVEDAEVHGLPARARPAHSIASSEALPPTAEVLIVTVRSCA